MNSNIFERVMNNPNIRNLGLREEIIRSMVTIYQDELLNVLLENGHVELTNGMNMEVVRLTDRVHVLRGVPYQSSRKYKLKLTMEEKLYDKVDKYYENLMKEIE